MPSSRLHTKPQYQLSAIPRNPLGEGNYIRTAAALIIGDEVLNGKTLDQNSHTFAKYCFEQGVELRRIEVIADDEQEIAEASRRMVQNYDFVITTGGIGPTHDDITYASLAKSFGQSLGYHEETLRRMDEMNKSRDWVTSQTASQKKSMQRMALFPDQAEVLFVSESIWVPVIRLEGKLCVFPGIPKLFQTMLSALTPFLPLPPPSERPQRIQIFTSRPESLIAPYLTTLQDTLKDQGVSVGSYPVLGKGVFVSLIGRPEASRTVNLDDIAHQVAENLDGELVHDAHVAEKKNGAYESEGTNFSVEERSTTAGRKVEKVVNKL
ncbi:Molybdopterin binding protein [Cylindrobasidium torrendii FP15055 ss-10]|uniref:Molybdopterin binding protein n=1 Tax=Cylindrobasidium torrendii FP15055 ss-10 TaxID=1314674 RepID=A0A0D7BEP9_9AGAR|nr:Molybdopterin binding protein [Cylindrobasidium torrendii FP15055 ss-10]